jgi:hypothetical protein
MRCPKYSSWTVVTCLLALAAPTAFPQAAEPTIRSATFYTVKPSNVADFLSATKDWAALHKKSGSERYYHLWAASSGTSEYVLVSHHAKWSEIDTTPNPKLKDVQGEVAALRARIQSSIESSRRVISSILPDISLPMGSAEPPPMVRVIRTWVRPEHADAYQALIKSDILPAARKSGLSAWGVARVRYGGSIYEFQSVAAVANWAEMDGESPIIKAMGGQAVYQKFLAKQRPLVARSEYEMYRLLKDQSHLPPAK